MCAAATPSAAPIAHAAGWQDYVPAPKTATPQPVRVGRVIGDVSNAQALTAGGTGSAVLSSPPGAPKATVVLDFGQDVGGTPQVSVDDAAPDSGGAPQIVQGWSEGRNFVLSPAGDPSVDNGSTQSAPAVPGTTVGRTFVGGFRWYALQLSNGTATLSHAQMQFGAYRGTADKYQGHFVSSSDALNRLWYAGAYTTQLDMAAAGTVATGFLGGPSVARTDSVFDGAKRDRAIWTGDLVVEDPVIWLSLGSNGNSYVSASIQRFLDNQDSSGRLASAADFPAPGINFDYANTYSAYAAIAAIDYYRRTADRAFIDAALPKLEKATAYHATLLDANGLVVSNDNDYWQTTQNGEVTEYSLAYVQLLRDMSWLERALGNADKAASYDKDAAAVANAINARLWNAEAGAYQQSDSSRKIPLDANANAIRLGVAPADRVPGILEVLRNGWNAHGARISQPAPSLADPYGHTIEPLNNGWEMEARLVAGDDAGALDLMGRLYGQMLDKDNRAYTGATWEFLYDDGASKAGFDSLAHGWSAAGTRLLTEYVLGVAPTGPGYSTFTVAPHPADLAWAEGTVPTPHGPIRARWEQTPDGLRLALDVPNGTKASVRLPGVSSAAAVGPGSHEFSAPAAASEPRQSPACASRRRFTVHVRLPRRFRASSALVRIGGTTKRVKVRVRRRRAAVPVDLRGRPRGTVTVRLSLRSRGRTVKTARRYRLCA
jgi:hypothetical protein